MENKVRFRAVISGRVQGVFFRMETQQAARGCNVTGWVKNRPDGTVEAVFEGDPDRVEEMLQWCWKGPATARVENVDVMEETYTGRFPAFEITR